MPLECACQQVMMVGLQQQKSKSVQEREEVVHVGREQWADV